MEPISKHSKLDKSEKAAIGSQPLSKINEPSNIEIDEQDLPLLANVDQVKVIHYLLKLHFNLNTKEVQGVLVIFLKPTNPLIPWGTIILDSCFIKVHNVLVLKFSKDFQSSDLTEMNKAGRENLYNHHSIDWFTTEGSELQFEVEKWSLRITGWPSDDIGTCPSVIRIHYNVLPSTPSLNWRPTKGWKYDQGPKCVFTPASPVNNRGLFPCQEPSSAMATWECFIQTEKSYLPLLTSDRVGEVVAEDEETKTHYFYSSMDLPMSTFAVVIGDFFIQTPVQDIVVQEEFQDSDKEAPVTHCSHDNYPCRISKKNTVEMIQFRLFSISDNLNLNVDEISNFIKVAIRCTHKVLGTFPFGRLDIIILPKCFADLGLCSPSMIFLSPSLFLGDEPLYKFRIPHEISHFWFGLLIGALDWREEFLSEGFATFMEDVMYKEIFRGVKADLEIMKDIDTRACLRLLTLQNELKNTEGDLQVLRLPSEESCSTNFLKHGLAPMKQFMQVHYLKGFFLLKHLSHLVGEEDFLIFLKKYVHTFHGQLVSSDMFFRFYIQTFSRVLQTRDNGDLFLESIKSNWLSSKVLPEPFKSCDILKSPMLINPQFLEMFPRCEEGLDSIEKVIHALSLSSEPKLLEPLLDSLSSCQWVLCLEKMIAQYENDKSLLKNVSTLKCSYESLIASRALEFKLMTQDPELLHRFGELIILNRDKSRKQIVETFLEDHISLGVYLFGELMISEEFTFQKIAKRVYKKLFDVLDSGQRKVLEEMIF